MLSLADTVNGLPLVAPVKITVLPEAAAVNSRNSATFGPRSFAEYPVPNEDDEELRTAANSVAICVVVAVVPTVMVMARPLIVTVAVSFAAHVLATVSVSTWAMARALPVLCGVAI